MKVINKILAAAAAVLAMGLAAGCTDDVLEENTSLELGRCLQPMNLTARVQSAYGNKVTFNWDVTKDADNYVLIVCSDSDMTQEVLNKTLSPDEVPFTADFLPDMSYYYKVQALADGKEDSKWAVGEKSVKTYAVKDPLYLTVSDRQATTLSFTWSTEVEDFDEVDRLDWFLPGEEEPLGTKTLSPDEIAAGAATIEGLTASTQYEVALFYASANRGAVSVWTLPDMTGLTTVATSAALQQAILDGASIYLKMEGSPYTISSDPTDFAKGLDVTKGFKVYGEGGADGNGPVIYGDINITDAFDGGDIYFESVTLDGQGKCGFIIQHKEGSTTDGVAIGSIKYKNCVITNFTKGLFYEWAKTVILGELSFESCDITLINEDGIVGGDGVDLRYESVIDKISFNDCTIANGFRTFFRNYPQTTGSPAATIKELVFTNNTVSNLCAVNSTNNAGLFAFTEVPGAFTFKNNLFLNMGEKAALVSSNAKYFPLNDLNTTAAKNYFHNCPEATFFNSNATVSMAAGKILDDAPCYNAAGGIFNILPDSEIAGEGIGASKWWVAYTEEPMDLRLTDVGAKHTWDFSDAKYFTGTIKKAGVADNLATYTEACPFDVEDGVLSFTTASVVTRKGVPTDGFLAFKVSQPGSVIVKPVNGGSNHVVVAVGDIAQNDETTIKSSSVTVKGGASEMVNSGTAQKIILSDITEESIVYIYASGPIGLSALAWSDDVAQVNTALGTPVVSVAPTSITEGEATDVTVTWDAVSYAGSYSVVFSGKSETVSDGCEYVIPGQTIGFLSSGAYKVEVYANPAEGDVYNTPSAAGIGAFAIVPAGGGAEKELIVNNLDELNAAIAAGKTAITLAAGEYETGELVVSSPLALKGQDGAIIKGSIKLSGAAVGDVSFENITFDASGKSIFINLDNSEGVTAGDITVKDCVIRNYTHSVIYASNSADKFNLGNVLFDGVEVYDHGTSQGMFDLRNGTYGSFTLQNSTLTKGRDFLRIDATCTIPSVTVKNNTMYNLNTTKNGNGVFFVRASVSSYSVENNLLLGMTSGTVIGKSGAKVPAVKNNWYYDCNDAVFFTGIMDKAAATANGGAVLAASPVKDMAGLDFTLTNVVVMSSAVGAPKWNPQHTTTPADVFTVNNVDEFNSAVGAGKTAIKFAAGTYDMGEITLAAGMHLSGESGAVLNITQIAIPESAESLGDLTIENLTFVGDNSHSFINVTGVTSFKTLTVRNIVVSDVKSSLYYDNSGATADALVLNNVTASGLGKGQGTFDIRKGTYGSLTIAHCTVTGGRDLLRVDAGHVTDAVNFVNNTIVAANPDKNGNGLMYVRSTPTSYVFTNNLFLSETNTLLSKASGVTVPTEAADNYFYDNGSILFTGLFTQEVAAGTVLAESPVVDIAGGDYTVTNDECKSKNIGAARWR